MGVTEEISRDHLVLGISKETFHRSFRGFFDCVTYSFIGSLLSQSNGQIYNRHIGCWHSEGHAVNFPFKSGITFPTACAAPVEAGMIFWAAPRPSLQALFDGPSTVFCVAVTACTVVIKPSIIWKLSLTTLARGARQLVVQLALETTFWPVSYFSWLTPITYIGASADGAEMITFFAPLFRWTPAFSVVVKTPVLSTMYSAPASPHLILPGSLSPNTTIFAPFTYRNWPSCFTSPENFP